MITHVYEAHIRKVRSPDARFEFVCDCGAECALVENEIVRCSAALDGAVARREMAARPQEVGLDLKGTESAC